MRPLASRKDIEEPEPIEHAEAHSKVSGVEIHDETPERKKSKKRDPKRKSRLKYEEAWIEVQEF